jgi:hypothetical protein
MPDHLGISVLDKILIYLTGPIIIGISIMWWAVRRATNPPREKKHKGRA